MDAKLEKLVSRLEEVTKKLESIDTKGSSEGSSSAGAAAGEESPKVIAFDSLVQEHIPKFLSCAQKIGGDTDVLSQMVNGAIKELRSLLVLAASSKKPSDSELPNLLKPLSEKMSEIIAFRDKRRPQKDFDHLSVLSEGVSAFGWVSIAPLPEPFAQQARGGSEFYSNKLLNLYKGKDENQLDWVRTFNGFLKGMEKFIKENHRTGLEWTGKGEAKAGVGAGASSKPASAPAASAAPAAAKPAGANVNVMAELSKGLDVTAGLKKVEKSEMTHKNPALRAGGVVAAKDDAPKNNAAKKGLPTGTPAFELKGAKWVVEFQDGNKGIVIDKTEIKHTVYIYGCFDTVVQIKGKVNQVTLDSCKKTSVVCTDVMASIDLVNVNSVQVQVTGSCPTFSVEKTSGCQLFLGKDCLKSEIITSKSDSVNVHVPKGEEFVEAPVPEQFKTTINEKGELVTVSVEHKGG